MSASVKSIGVLIVIACTGSWAQPRTEPAASAEPAAPAGEARTNGLVAVEDLPVLETPSPAQVVGPVTTRPVVDLDRLLWHLPDPAELRETARQKARQAQDALERGTETARDAKAEMVYYQKLAHHLGAIDRPRKLHPPLSEVLHRALAHSYAIRIESYSPAIEQTRVVEAEAAFDTTFFANMTKNIQNVPVASVLQGSNIDAFLAEGGLRQLLPVGMQVSTSLQMQRLSNDFQFQQIDPQYNSAFKVEFRQPMLRGFGLDFNRSQINLAKNDKRISDQAFARQVQDTLRDAETAYWRVFQARRIVGVQARLLATFEQIYERLEQRGKFDVIPIQINETKARLESANAAFIRICNELRDAEDALIALVNDPQFDLADNIEIIPVDFPTLEPLVLDRLAEVQSALDHRQEIAEAKLRVNSAKILVGAAKNQAMPKLDLVFSYMVDGLGVSADDAFDQVTMNDFHEYFIGVELELPVGNRARRAQERGARLQHAQSIAVLKQTFEKVILDVNVRVREVLTQLNLIGPNLDSSEASEAQVDSIRARAETQNYIQLSNELTAIRSLAASRNELLATLVNYNIAIIELERAKGTLLDYYNVVIPEQE